MDIRDVLDLVSSIMNDCRIIQRLSLDCVDVDISLLHTVAEDLYSKIQTLIDEFCIKTE